MAKGNRGGRRRESPNRGQPSTDGNYKYAIAYHGTNADFDKFDRSKSDKHSVDAFGEGYYFADSAERARGYGDIVYEVEIRYSTDRKAAKGTDRARDYMYNADNGYWVIPSDKADNLKVVRKKRVQ